MEKKRTHNLMSGALIMAASTLIVKIIGVMYKVPLSYMIGEEGMGYFNTAYAVYGFFYVISSAGIPKAVTMTVARCDEYAALSSGICKALLKVFAAFGITLSLLLIIFARPLAVIVGNSRSYATMLAIAPSIFLVTLSGVLRGYLNGISHMLPIAISQLIEGVSKLLFGLLLAGIGSEASLPLPIISALAILGITLGSFFSLIYMYFACFGIGRRRSAVTPDRERRREILKDVIKKATPITMSAAVGAAAGILDMLTIINGLRSSGFSESLANASYGNYSTLAVPMVGLVSSLLMPITMVILPRLSKSDCKDDIFGDTLKNGWIITLALATPMALALSLYSFEILDILFSSAQSANGAPALAVLALSAVLLPLLSVVNTALEASGATYKALLSLLCGLALKAAIAILLIPISNIGIVGAAIGTTASYAFSLAISLIFLGKSTRRVKGSTSIVLAAIAVVSFVPPFILIYATNLLRISAISMLVSLAVSAIIYLSILLPFFLGGCFGNIIMHKKNARLKR